MQRVRYPRTPHLPWSPGATSDDVRLVNLSCFEGKQVVVTEKLDGENTTLYADGLHARSLDSAHHPSRTWVKALQGRIARHIPAGWRICGENMLARHSIAYENLDSLFYAFSVWTEADECLPWDATVRFTRRLGIPTPPVLWAGIFNEKAIRALRLDLTKQEGYVVRTAAGFPREQFTSHVAKWVRTNHVQTDEHWMWAAVVENTRGPSSVFWDLRSGSAATAANVLRALNFSAFSDKPASEQRLESVLGSMLAQSDTLGRIGDRRLAGALAAVLHEAPRAVVMAELANVLGIPLARRVGDLLGMRNRLGRPFPDEERRAGLVKMARAVDVGTLHALAAATLQGDPSPESKQAHELISWSALHAADAGLFEEEPLSSFKTELQGVWQGLDPDTADRCYAEALEAYAEGQIHSAAEAEAYTWRWRSGQFPRLVLMVGPSGSGKSTFTEKYLPNWNTVSMDELRTKRGSRFDQTENMAVLSEALEQLHALLAANQSVVWDATSLNQQQRNLPMDLAKKHNALTTHATFLIPKATLLERNARRPHSVPERILASQFARFSPPYPGQAHRAWYIGQDGSLADTANAFHSEEA